MTDSRVCPRCSFIHDDIHESGGKYQVCNRCLEEMDDAYGEDDAESLKVLYDFSADDHNFRAARERK